MKKVSLQGATAAVAVSALTLTGFVGSSAHSAQASSPISYLIQDPGSPVLLNSIKADIKNFEKQSGVTVNLRVEPDSLTRATLQVQLQSGEGPDVFEWGTGAAYAGVLAKAGLLYDITSEYAKKQYTVYKWTLPFVTFGGKIVGIPDQIEEEGFFYNKDLFAKLGISAPANLAALEKDLATIKAAGVLPITMGDKEGYEGNWALSMSLTSMVGPTAEKNLAFGKSNWNTPAVAATLSIWKTWEDKGWLSPFATSISGDNANAAFFSGKAAMDPTGTWNLQDLPSEVKFHAGLFPFPGFNNSGSYSADLGNGTFMSAKTKNPAAALKLMDYMAGQDHGKWEVSQYFIPAFPVSTAGVTDPLFKKVISDLAAYATGHGSAVGQLLDGAGTAEFNLAMYNGMQAVLNGSSTAAQVVQKLQAAPRPAD